MPSFIVSVVCPSPLAWLTLTSATDEEDNDESAEILESLEEIDGEADQYGVDFVRISDTEAFTEHNVVNSPALVYYRKKTPLLYDGNVGPLIGVYDVLSHSIACLKC